MNINKAYDIAIAQQNRFLSQRTTSYHFSLILFALLINALISLWSESFTGNALVVYSILALLISLTTVVLSFLFYGVDTRTLTFLKSLEELLMKYEKAILNGETATELLYFIEERRIRDKFNTESKPFFNISKKKISTFGRAFLKPKLGSLIHFTYIAFFVLGLVSVGISIWSFGF